MSTIKMHLDPTDHAMVEAITKVGRVMGIKTIAEYVESQPILDALIKLDVDYVQGHHIAPPIPMSQWQPYSAMVSMA